MPASTICGLAKKIASFIGHWDAGPTITPASAISVYESFQNPFRLRSLRYRGICTGKNRKLVILNQPQASKP